uniref:Uncharacterized protein n=1 Tax=Aegilops tauschii subsp. strangulata TaxID=200361 RepID=A0A453MY02_AEGTS
PFCICSLRSGLYPCMREDVGWPWSRQGTLKIRIARSSDHMMHQCNKIYLTSVHYL